LRRPGDPSGCAAGRREAGRGTAPPPFPGICLEYAQFSPVEAAVSNKEVLAITKGK